MQTAVKIVLETVLDTETVQEIAMIRELRLSHYKKMATTPDLALAALQKIGLTEITSAEQLQAKAYQTIVEIETRQLYPNVIYEDEISLYIESLREERKLVGASAD